jgi:hypothetical protein
MTSEQKSRWLNDRTEESGLKRDGRTKNGSKCHAWNLNRRRNVERRAVEVGVGIGRKMKWNRRKIKQRAVGNWRR